MMIRICAAMPLLSVALLQVTAFAASHMKPPMTNVRPLAVSAEANAEMARYSLRAYENCDPTNAVQALLFTPKPVGMNPLPMVVYIPGNGELGSVARQFRQRAIFDIVTSAGFQGSYPCYLLAVSPPVFSHGGTPLNNRNASQDDIWLSLAKYVPAVSSPVGGSATLNRNNVNLNDVSDVGCPNEWGRDHNVYEESWLHSDMKDMAYFYVYKLYEQLVTRGDMQ